MNSVKYELISKRTPFMIDKIISEKMYFFISWIKILP